MKNPILCITLLCFTPLLIASDESPTFGSFRGIARYHQTLQSSHVALFVSENGEGNPGVVDIEASPEIPSQEKIESLSDLPLVEVPAAGESSATGKNTKMMGIIITGDGGWGVTDRGIAQKLAASGIPVVGLNSLRYFWKKKTPEQCATDLNRILQHYSAVWNRNEAVVIGYSFGADVLPFALNRIPEESLKKIKVIAFLGLSSTADFEFHMTDWISNRQRSTSRKVLPEVEKLRGKKLFCFYGTEDEDALCKDLDPDLAKVVPIQGGHRFRRDYQPVVDVILQEIK
jgi:type IV secretory pathway VirJ component